jgi:DNA-binding NarL/FixJ family response regulator
MRTSQQHDQLREEAVALRLAGKSVREIKDALGPVGKRTLSAALKDTPPPEWTRRPNAKDDLREQARELRAQGLSYNEIAAELNVSKGSVSLWVRKLRRSKPQRPRSTN